MRKKLTPASFSIRKKLLLLLLIIFLPAFGIIFVSGLKQRRDAIKEAQNSALLVVQSLTREQELIATTTKTLLLTLAQTRAVQALDTKACNQLLASLRDRFPVYSAVLAATTPDGNMFAASLPFKQGAVDLSDRKHIQDALRTREFSVGEYMTGRVSSAQSLNYALPVLDTQNRVTAILVSGFNLHEFRNSVRAVGVPEGYSVTISDWKGIRFYRLPETLDARPGMPIGVAVAQNSDEGMFEKASVDGAERIFVFRKLRLRKDAPPYMYIVVGVPKAAILQKANVQMLKNLSILGLAALMAMLLATVSGDFLLVRPIGRLVAATKNLAKGKRYTRTGLRHSGDELGQLAKSFDEMAVLLDQRLREIEQRDARFRDLAGAIREVFWMLDLSTGQMLYVSPAYEELSGVSCDELYSHPETWLLRIHEKDRSEVKRRLFEQAFQCEYQEKFRIVRPDGSVRWVRNRVSPVRDGSGVITRVAGVAVDVTEQLSAQEALAKAERQLASIVDSSDDAIIGSTLDGCITLWSQGAQRIFGYTMEEALGKPLEMLCFEGKEAEMAEVTERITRGERLEHFETLRRHQDGRAIRISLSASPVRDQEGNIVGISKVAHDVCKRKQLEEELLATAGRLRVVLENTNATILAVDRQWRITYANRALDLNDPGAMLGRTLWEVQPGLTGTVFETDFHRAMAAQSPSFTEAYYPPDQAWYTSTAYPSEEGLLIIRRDVTERRTLEDQIRNSQKMEAIGQLAAGIAHEINTPIQYVGDNTNFVKECWEPISQLLTHAGEMRRQLAAGDGGADIVARYDECAASADLDYIVGEMPRAIEQSIEGIQRVSKIVQAMKEFSHPGMEEKRAIDINRAIETTITVAKNEWKYVAEMTTCFDRSLPPVPCIAGEFNQVILNLLVNAAHAISEATAKSMSQDKGQITISTRRAGNCVEIAVQDSGTGIPEKIRARVFDPFFTTKEVGKGTGQGLNLAHTTIVKRHDGKLWFETEEGKGTTFFVQIPLAAPEALSA